MRNRWTGLILMLVTLVVGFAVYSKLPDQVPTHWNASGEADGYSSRLFGVVMLPLLGIGIWALLQFLPRIDPRKENYESFLGTYFMIINATMILLAAIQVIVLASGLGYEFSVGRLIPVGVGLFLAFIGHQLGRIRPNWWAGIRTPWTLADDTVWRRTHRFGAKIFVIGGLSIAIAGAVLPGTYAAIIVVSASVVLGLIPAAYSYVIWRELGEHQTNT